MSKLKVTFWGVRGSYPTSGHKAIKYGGNTTCLSIETDNKILIFDSGSGIINLGKKIIDNLKYKESYIFYTHYHKDHIDGLPFFAPLNHMSSNIYFFGPKFLNDSVKDILVNLMDHNLFPISLKETHSNKSFYTIYEKNKVVIRSSQKEAIIINVIDKDFQYEKKDIVISILKSSSHPKSGVIVYKIEYDEKSIVFATDIESYIHGDNRLIKFSKNADILIHDATYTNESYDSKQGWGHSTPKMAAENAAKANVKRLYLTHHDPEDNDKIIEKKLETAKKYFENSFLASDYLEFEI